MVLEQQQQIETLQKENTAIKIQNEKLLTVFEKLNQKVELLSNAKENAIHK